MDSDITDTPLNRSAVNYEEDRRFLYDRLANNAFKEWPNEAGFDGLTEERGPIELTVSGSIPTWAAGSLFRTGPGMCSVKTKKGTTFRISHWFDGLAHTHRFDIEPVLEQGKEDKVRVVYSSRRQSDDVMKDIETYGRLRSFSFGQRAEPCIGLFGKIMSIFCSHSDLHNVSVTVNSNIPGLVSQPQSTEVTRSDEADSKTKWWLATDNAFYREIDPKSLEPIGPASQVNLHPDLKGPCSCAHAQRDPHTGDYYNFNLEPGGREGKYRVFHSDVATGKTRVLATIGAPAAYIHSFFMTEDFLILCIPVAHYALAGLKMLWERNLASAIQAFNPEETCRWFVIDRHQDQGVVAYFESPASFFFHSINAFQTRSDEGNQESIICDYIQYEDLSTIDALRYDVLMNREEKASIYARESKCIGTSASRYVRYEFSLSGPNSGRLPRPTCSFSSISVLPTLKPNIAQPQCLAVIGNPHTGDLPTINPHKATLPYRFAYSLPSRGLSTFVDCISKLDVETQKVLIWQGLSGHTPGEAIFVPNPKGLEEDDGVLLSIVLDGTNKFSYLLCLDAKTMTELGRAECDFPIGFGFHGQHQSQTL